MIFGGGLALDVESAPFKAFLVVGGVLLAEDVFGVGGFPTAAGKSAFHDVGSLVDCVRLQVIGKVRGRCRLRCPRSLVSRRG